MMPLFCFPNELTTSAVFFHKFLNEMVLFVLFTNLDFNIEKGILKTFSRKQCIIFPIF